MNFKIGKFSKDAHRTNFILEFDQAIQMLVLRLVAKNIPRNEYQ